MPTVKTLHYMNVRNTNNGGCALILDNVTTKLMCSIRKQSELDSDLASKYKYLHKKASWVHKSQYTYDSNQLAL